MKRLRYRKVPHPQKSNLTVPGGFRGEWDTAPALTPSLDRVLDLKSTSFPETSSPTKLQANTTLFSNYTLFYG